jgi:hypothetical protein
MIALQLAPARCIDPAGSRIRRAIGRACRSEWPYRHWRLNDVLPHPLCDAVCALPFAPPRVSDTCGKRETHNSQRIFVSTGTRRRFAACDALADAFQDEATVGLLQDLCEIDLDGSFLRIECCLDTDGFWLAPHTDIGAKLLTLLIYLSDDPQARDWGTDIMDPTGKVLDRVPGDFNDGLMFVPDSDTWHGFAKRRISGIRRTLIVNYVKPEWRSRHELAFPETPVLAA